MCEATYMYVCRVIWVNNMLLAGQKCDIIVCVQLTFSNPGITYFAGKVCSATAGLSC